MEERKLLKKLKKNRDGESILGKKRNIKEMKNKREEMVLNETKNGRTKNYATYETCRRKKKYLKGRIP